MAGEREWGQAMQDDITDGTKWLIDQKTATLKPGQASDTKYVLPEAGISLDEVEKDLIIQALEKAGNNRTLAAKLLSLSYDTLRYQIKKFGLK